MMTSQHLVAAALLVVLCACETLALYQATCKDGRVLSDDSSSTLEVALWKKTFSALSVVYGAKIDIEHARTLNDTIARRINLATNDLVYHKNHFSTEQQKEMEKLLEKTKKMYSSIGMPDLQKYADEVSQAESVLTSIKDIISENYCSATSAFLLGSDAQKEIRPILAKYQEAHDTMESFRNKMKEMEKKLYK